MGTECASTESTASQRSAFQVMNPLL